MLVMTQIQLTACILAENSKVLQLLLHPNIAAAAAAAAAVAAAVVLHSSAIRSRKCHMQPLPLCLLPAIAPRRLFALQVFCSTFSCQCC
jgi:hypothetical protein